MYTDTFAPATSAAVPTTADIVIVGGGIAGVSLAAELAGRARVVVLEAEPALFRHTSSRSAQQVQPSYGPPAVRQLTRSTLRMLRQLDTPVLSPRRLYVIALDDPARLDAVLGHSEGLRVTTPEEVQEGFPALVPGLVRAAAADDEASEVSVHALLERYSRRALAGGAEFVSGARVEGISREGSGFRVETRAGTISAPVVVNAAGAWADELAGLAGAAALGLVPTRRSVVLSTPTAHTVGPDWPMIYDAAGSVYFRPRGSDVLASPLEDRPSPAEDAHPESAVIDDVLARVNALTTFGLATAHEAWTGLRTVSPDDVPVVGHDERVEGFYWLAGQGGYGIQTSAAIAALAAADLTGDALPLGPDDHRAFRALHPARLSG